MLNVRYGGISRVRPFPDLLLSDLVFLTQFFCHSLSTASVIGYCANEYSRLWYGLSNIRAGAAKEAARRRNFFEHSRRRAQRGGQEAQFFFYTLAHRRQSFSQLREKSLLSAIGHSLREHAHADISCSFVPLYVGNELI